MSFLNFFRTRKRLTVYAIVFLVVLSAISAFGIYYLSKNKAIYFSKNRTVHYICKSVGSGEGEEDVFHVSVTGDVVKTRHHLYKCKRYSHLLQCGFTQRPDGLLVELIFDEKNSSFYGVFKLWGKLSSENKYFSGRCYMMKLFSGHYNDIYYSNKYGGCFMPTSTCRREKKHHWWSNII